MFLCVAANEIHFAISSVCVNEAKWVEWGGLCFHLRFEIVVCDRKSISTSLCSLKVLANFYYSLLIYNMALNEELL